MAEQESSQPGLQSIISGPLDGLDPPITCKEAFEETIALLRYPLDPISEGLKKELQITELDANSFVVKLILDGKKLDSFGYGKGDGTDRVRHWKKVVAKPEKMSITVTDFVPEAQLGEWLSDAKEEPLNFCGIFNCHALVECQFLSKPCTVFWLTVRCCGSNMDLEKQKLLNTSPPAVPSAAGTAGICFVAPEDRTKLVLNVVGTCLTFAALVSFLDLLLDYFVDTWLWPILGCLLVSGHLLLVLGLNQLGSPFTAARQLALAALICEGIAYVALASTYFFPSFIVPFWWWHAIVLIFLWPAMVLVQASIFFGLCAKPEATSGLVRYLHYIAFLGLFFVACVCFLCSILLLFAGGTAIKDYVISILPGDGIGPPGIGEKIITASTKTVFKVPICDMSNSSCSLKDMPLHQWTAVKPGGNTRCLLGDYAFRVWRGNSSRVLLTFDGGGSCWNWPTFVGAMCSPAVGFNWDGIMKIDDPGNPFYGYTVVEVVYCSGDAFAGAAEHFWIMPAVSASAWKPMMGYANTLSVMEWTKAQFEGPEPGLTSPLESFVISGESAGALGVQLWQADILERFKGRYQDKKTIFIADSFLGLQVNDLDALQRGIMDYWGLCESGIIPSQLLQRCLNRNINIRDLVLYNLKTYPEVRLLMPLSKFDQVQIIFGDLVAAFREPSSLLRDFLSGKTDKVQARLFNSSTFYQELTAHVSMFAAYPQFAVFLVNADYHGFTLLSPEKLNATTPAGLEDNCSKADVGQRLLQWLNPETKQTNQCYSKEGVDLWTADFCNSSIPWNPGSCTK
eukprot:s2555_g13.t1